MTETKRQSWTAWPHQVEAIDRLREHVRQGDKRIVVTIPTGGGKTGIAAEVSRRFTENGKRGLFIVHRQELVSQTEYTMNRMGIRTAKITAGTKMEVGCLPICICTVQTLSRRLANAKKFNQRPQNEVQYVWWDECHHIAASTWKRVSDILREWYPGIVEIGLTATPRRPDGKGLDNVFDKIIEPASIKSLISDNYLCGYRMVRPKTELASIRKQIKQKGRKEEDFNQKEQTTALSNKIDVIAGETVSLYRQYANGEQAIFFGVDIPHSKRTAAQFNNAGISCVHIDGETDPYVRRRHIHNFRVGRIRVLCNVGIVNEGFDVPETSCVILGRHTKSVVFYLQAIGRALRYRPGKIATIIDQAGNSRIPTLGMPDDDRAWDLSGNSGKRKEVREKSASEKRMRMCKKCFILSKEDICPKCGESMIEATHIVEHKSEFVVIGSGEGGEVKKKPIPPKVSRQSLNAELSAAYRAHERNGEDLMKLLSVIEGKYSYGNGWALRMNERYMRLKRINSQMEKSFR